MTRMPIAIIGRSCRLPGADDVERFWQLLVERRCAVRAIDGDRWATGRFLHHRKGEPGKAYTFAAGVLDDVWGFDPTVFSISPREAEQMDPQQRIALQLVWEALEDAGVPPSKLAGTETGVFVGASALDYASRGIFDPAGIDAYFATGNALSIVSNRISYAFDLRGPSFTVDTACSSSLVALHEAALAIETGRIETAVVVGVNILASPAAFVGFAQASMLSPRGLCRAFDAGADGYVRAEGGVALVLRSERAAKQAGDVVYGFVLGSGVNSDGRTVGMSFPSSDAQIDLLRRVYAEAAVEPEAVAFIEAHGTGTRVGDPAEALAVGRALATHRREPLPIGSVKTNVGHLEPASGLVGVLKAMLALERRLLPASLHVETLNPDIPFDQLNLRVATEPVPLTTNGRSAHAAGINSFGFGGTNAHVIVGRGPSDPAGPRAPQPSTGVAPLLVVSAQSREALVALAGAYGDLLAGKDRDTAARVASSVPATRDLLSHRLVVDEPDVTQWSACLAAVSSGSSTHNVVMDTAVGRGVSLAFMYSGNGSQWAGMGRAFHGADAVYRESFAEVDARFRAIGGWSLHDALFASDLDDRLQRASIAQPLLFATQVATTAALRARGVTPRVVFGHSVGEVAAAHAAGALTLDQAVEVIHSRSRHQEITWKTGTMAAVLLPVEEARQLILAGGFDELEIAAINSGRSLTVSGPVGQIRAMARLARARRVATRILELDYPFHTALTNGVRAPLLADLGRLKPHDCTTLFVSAVTGDVLPGVKLDAGYWWDNVRKRVRFAEAVASAIQSGARIFVEIGPRPVLQSYANDGLVEAEVAGAVLSCEDYKMPADRDPARHTLARIIAKGGAVESSRAFGELCGRPERLPTYRWHNRRFVVAPTLEMQDAFGLRGEHPLVGARGRVDGTEWSVHLDPSRLPYLGDHKVDGRILVPGAALVEMALAAGRAWLEAASVELQDFDITHPLALEAGSLVEVTTRISAESRTVEILSRPRLHNELRTLHAFGRVGVIPTRVRPSAPPPPEPVATLEAHALYELARAHGLDFGPSFQGAERIDRLADGRIRVTLRPQDPALIEAKGYGFYPPALDSCFHGLVQAFAEVDHKGAQVAYVPIRFGAIRLYRPGSSLRTALIEIKRMSPRSIQAAFVLLDEGGEIVATLEDCRFHAVPLSRRPALERLAYHGTYELLAGPFGGRRPTLAPEAVRQLAQRAGEALDVPQTRSDDDLLLEGFAVALARDAVRQIVPARKRFTTESLAAEGRVAAASAPLLEKLLALLLDRGHAVRDDRGWRLVRKAGLPAADAILRTVIADHPGRVAETVLGARASALLPRVLREGPGTDPPFSAGTLLHFRGSARPAKSLTQSLAKLVRELIAQWPADQPLRILEIGAGSGAFTRVLAASAGEGRVTLTASDPDPLNAERLRFAFGTRRGVTTRLIDLAKADARELGRFDLVVSADPLAEAVGSDASLRRLPLLIRDGGLLALAVLGPSPFVDVVFGLDVDRIGRLADPSAGLLRTPEAWAAQLCGIGLVDVAVTPVPGTGGPALLVLASPKGRKTSAEATQPPQGRVVLVGSGTDAARRLAVRVTRKLEAAGCAVQLLDHEGGGNGQVAPAGWGNAPAVAAELARHHDELPVDVIDFAGAPVGEGLCSDAVSERIGRTLGLARAVTDTNARLWVLAPGALQGVVYGGTDCPAQAALAGFLRVLTNETRSLDVRLVDPDPDLDEERVAAELARAILSPPADREIVITRDGVRAPRLSRGLPQFEGPPKRPGRPVVAQLGRGAEPGIDGLTWTQAAATTPKRDEVSIDIEAAGLNFRDVMWALGLLPEEALEDGFAGPALGIEGAGTVVAVGSGVRRVKLGDRVMTFAKGALASRVVVPEVAVAPLPTALDFAAGATIPVAFLTAYYALHHLARLSRGEWLLVHGGAGGVGLAALQIARWRGARTIATAGSEEKHDFLRMLGADHVLSSRTLDFVDGVRTLTGGHGVNVVLNSLAKEAMERSLEVIAPFGRFLELGKRDYYANTRIGLRPFRRNVSYFGIDADQLLAYRRPLTERLMREIVRLFEKGVFSPLPYRVFAAEEFRDAFRLMQQSLHVGKLVITPPRVAEAVASTAPAFRAAAEGTHVVVGGLGGFGLAVAAWLVEQGARHLVLLGRRGAATNEARAAVERIRHGGAEVKVAACDVADFAALGGLFEDVARTMPPLKGVVHAAMVLDDGLISNLDRERVNAVLQPKVDGAANLDRLTRGANLDYFVLFSSATTFVGNPGQASYVAANSYLEGLARARRGLGLPALAVAWGAIEDVGYLARQASVREKLSRRLGHAGMTARDALEALGRLLAETDGGRRGPASLAVAPIDWATGRRELRWLSFPAYAQVIADAELNSSSGGDERISLIELVRGREPQAAREAVTAVLTAEVSRILKLPAGEIGAHRRLAELGMDSLMSLELRIGLERRFGVEVPLPALSDTTTLASIASTVVGRIQDPDQAPDAGENFSAVDADLARRHVADEVSLDDLADLGEAVQSRRSEGERVI
jgi:acyl transferase domain-containing protein/NADPH:quinone reductase-like Zn-dependent oxidoreductase/acyl carrier protein/short-subunit dehydrogenase